METKTIYGNRYTLNMVKTEKFKTNRLQISFGNDLSELTISKRSLVPYLLKAISKKYNSREIMSAYLENMYAAHFNVGVSKIAKTHFINFDLSFINDQYTLNNELLFDKALEFLKEVLFNPLFKESIFSEEYRLMKEYFNGIYANKLKYAVREMNNVMFKDETYRLNALGEESLLNDVDLDSCLKTYENMIDNDTIIINVLGDIDFDIVEKSISEHFSFKERTYIPVLIDKSTKDFTKVTEIINKIDVNQAKLVIGYRIDAYYHTENYLGAIMFNTLFGGTGESLLFKEIRDNLGLVYFISSSYDPYKGVLFIVSGINKTDYSVVLETINNIIQKIIDQDYSDEFLNITKTMQINGYIESLDSNIGLAARVSRDSLFHDKFDIDEVISRINSVTKDDITRAAKSLRKDTIYLLRDDKDE
ncbi:MAG: insulinase family protein [Candidatus Izimaplasma sp.]|nr:insulinase family protein [Candidatus Izimaplasma bacterium]